MREKTPIKAVIFDLDGTLLNTLEDLADSMNHVLAENGYPLRTLAEIRRFVGNGVRKLVERSMGYPDGTVFTVEQTARVDLLFAEMKTWYGEHCDLRTAPYPGIPEALQSLKEQGLHLAIVSNKVDPAVKDLNTIYFADWIPVAVGDQPGCQVKPAPDLLHLATRELGVHPEECLYVGDSEVDVQTAAGAGMECIAVTWGFRDPDELQEAGAVILADTPEQMSRKIEEKITMTKKEYRYLLFDLDGTLTNPEEGITKSVQYALREEFGIETKCRDHLRFIGPPLWDSFMQFYDLTKEEADRAVAKYRERYNDIGVYENFPYEGMQSLLQALKKQGYLLGVASSKPEVMVHKVLDKYELAEYFDVITGSELDGTRSIKSEVIEETLRRFVRSQTPDLQEDDRLPEIDRSQVLMIGDRKFDIIGAKEAGMDSCGVYYGFAEPGELEESGADYVVNTVAELRSLLCGKE